eukprot:GHVH01000549.1.p1 GENE.GHVH01000549.1~~GHVH01000549.1.p1  ORF type:complete len:621 (-),score=65.78 GHVH01000549.1:644-2506(-)
MTTCYRPKSRSIVYICDCEYKNVEALLKIVYREQLIDKVDGGSAQGSRIAILGGCVSINGRRVTNGGTEVALGDCVSVDLNKLDGLVLPANHRTGSNSRRRMTVKPEGVDLTWPQEDTLEMFTTSAMFEYYNRQSISLSPYLLKPLPLTIRVNRRHPMSELSEEILSVAYRCVRKLEFKGFVIDGDNRMDIPLAFAVDMRIECSPDILKFGQSIGLFTQQEISSMLPVIFLNLSDLINNPHEEHIIGDLCASPGSKTGQILDNISPRCTVIANDVDPSRVTRISQRLAHSRPLELITTCCDGTSLPLPRTKDDEIHFSKILVDAPCSGDGTVRKNPHKINRWHEGAANANSDIQFRLLEHSILSLANRGCDIVYSTCSMNPVENEAVVSKILMKYPDKVELVTDAWRDARVNLLPPVSVNGFRFPKNALIGRVMPRGAGRVNPTLGEVDESLLYGGFFLAKLRVIEQTVDYQKKPSIRFRPNLPRPNQWVETMCSRGIESLMVDDNIVQSAGLKSVYLDKNQQYRFWTMGFLSSISQMSSEERERLRCPSLKDLSVSAFTEMIDSGHGKRHEELLLSDPCLSGYTCEGCKCTIWMESNDEVSMTDINPVRKIHEYVCLAK